MTIPDRPRREPVRFPTYHCKHCGREVQYVSSQELPNYHRDRAGRWCVAPPSAGQVEVQR